MTGQAMWVPAAKPLAEVGGRDKRSGPSVDTAERELSSSEKCEGIVDLQRVPHRLDAMRRTEQDLA
ncbi:MAG TPA: hypothetical protein VGT82_00365 [Ktedonobacteraceae bacterium]|nr:hypothetical protein [Ktedonobacteraceae bacterium]